MQINRMNRMNRVSRETLDPRVAAMLFALAGILVLVAETAELISVRTGFVSLTIVVLLYLLTQATRVRLVQPQGWLLNPAVLCSGVTFAMSFGVGNILFFLPPATLEPLGMVPDVTPAMLKLMWLVLLGAIGMWLGYWSGLARFLSTGTRAANFAKVLRKSNQLRPWAIPTLLAISSLARILSINYGLFGYSSSYERLIEMGGVTQYFALASSLGKLALVVAALEYYSNRANPRVTALFFASLIIEILFGLLSGFKSAVAIPFVIVGVCQYLITNRLPKVWVFFVFFGVFAAYQVIEPFRDARNSDGTFQGTSVTEIARVMIDAGMEGQRSSVHEDDPGIAFSFLSRTSLVHVGSLGIAFVDQTSELPAGSPNFLSDILFTPLYAWVPRFVWDGKPVGDLGLWYTQVVLGYVDSYSSTAMSPFTFLYISGGAVAVFVGFLFVGVIQRSILALTQPRNYLSGAVVFLGVLQTISVLGDGFDSLLVSLMRELPLLLLLQRGLYRPRAVSMLRSGRVCAD